MSKNRIELLRERERELRLQITAEQIRLAKKRQKEDARVFSLVGRLLLEHAPNSPDLHLFLKKTLGTLVLDERSRGLLASRGLI
jgi:hypothetical protein